MWDFRQAAALIQQWFGLVFERPTGGRPRERAAAPAVARTVSSTTERIESSSDHMQPALPTMESHTADLPVASVVDEPIAATPAATIAPPQVNVPLKFALKSLDPEHPYLQERGLTEETIATFGVGFFKGKGIMANRVAIPIRNEHGALVAYAGRWPRDPPDGEGKYKLPAGFHKSLVVYNLHQAREYAKEHGLILVEGLFDCMKVWQAGHRNIVALMGSSMSEAHEHLIFDAVGPGGKVALMSDEDDAGWRCREDVMERLLNRVYVRVIPLGEEGAQPDKLDEETIRTLLG